MRHEATNMNNELFGVALQLSQNYNGRDQYGTIQRVMRGQGVLMTKDCAEKLCRILKHDHPGAHVVPLLRGDRDEMAATSLAELGEAVGLDKLAVVIEQCVVQGFSAEEIILKCQNAIESAAAEFAKQ